MINNFTNDIRYRCDGQRITQKNFNVLNQILSDIENKNGSAPLYERALLFSDEVFLKFINKSLDIRYRSIIDLAGIFNPYLLDDSISYEEFCETWNKFYQSMFFKWFLTKNENETKPVYREIIEFDHSYLLNEEGKLHNPNGPSIVSQNNIAYHINGWPYRKGFVVDLRKSTNINHKFIPVQSELEFWLQSIKPENLIPSKPSN